uniref:Ubiquitin fusion degradation protein 1 homolog n=1 Tax=Glossina morsitans morsitans TaxID=37546 RepID=A0A1B0FPL2_GLOMM
MFQFGGFNMMFPEAVRVFKASYKCFSVSMLPGNERQEIENGGKIIMPASALDVLTRLNIDYPMLFKLVNFKDSRYTHAGVLEFVADEGKCYLPYWMMVNLLLKEGDILSIENVSLPVAKDSKFQPCSIDFLDITNPKAVLENALRNFACLTTGDVIAIKYNKKVYELRVLETKPGDAVSIIECDMNVDFEAPVGYKDQVKDNKTDEESQDHVMEEVMETFAGAGVRLDGKKKKENQLDTKGVKKIMARGIPDYDYKFGQLTFDRSVKPITDRVVETDSNPAPTNEGFHGHGFSMKKLRK